MPNVSNPLVPVTDSLYSNFFITLRSLASSFLPSHLWYRPGQWGWPHRSSVFYLLRLSRTTAATHPLNFLKSLKTAASIGQPTPIPAPHWLPRCRSRPLAAGDSSSRETIQVKNRGKGCV